MLDLLLHLDTTLASVIAQYGTGTYVLLFLIIFCETGLVIAPFLPGDSLIFAAGAFAARGSLSLPLLFVLLFIAAVGGNTLNYSIGKRLGTRIFRDNAWILKRDYLERTREFYRKHGKKTVVITRFMPILRTVAPFVAGVGTMSYGEFLKFNLIGALLWVSLFLFGGFFFGTIPVVQKNFEIVILGIVAVSIVPGIVEVARSRMRK